MLALGLALLESASQHPLLAYGLVLSPSKADHPAHSLFQEVVDKVAGVSCGCADVFGATEDAEKSGFDLIKDNPVPGTSGLPSLRKLLADGYSILTF